MTDTAGHEILEWKEFSDHLERLKRYNQQAQLNDPKLNPNEYLEAYSALLKLRDAAFPLLLLEGPVRSFDHPPVNAYLLPPMDNVPKRWLLAYFVVMEHDTPRPHVQLLAWQADEKGACITAVADQPMQAITACDEALDLRSLRIGFTQMSDTCLIQVRYTTGVLDIVADAAHGIKALSWKKKDNKAELRVERRSCGDMPPAVKIQRYGVGQRWQDDRVLDSQDRPLLPQHFRPGRIRGADGPQHDVDTVYLASSKACVYRLDLNQPDSEPLASPTLPGEVLDVLAVPDPDQSEQTVILAAVQNGGVYLLREKDQKLGIVHWNYTNRQIRRLIGRGDEHVLALDGRGHMLPLRLADPDVFRVARDTATQQLYEKLSPCYTEADGFSHFQNRLEQQPQRFVQEGRAWLEYFLWSFFQSNPQHWDALRLFALWLNQSHADAQAEHKKTIASLHGQLIIGLLRWAIRSNFADQLSEKINACRRIEPALEVVWELLTPSAHAPDHLWLPLFRKYDCLRLWAKKHRLINEPRFAQRLAGWEQYIQKQRQNFSCGLHAMRPFNTLTSYRLASQPMSIVVLDENQGLFAAMNYTGGLRIFQHDGTATSVSDELDYLKHGKLWEGVPRVLLVLPPGSLRHASAKYVLLVGTIRGELVWLGWNGPGSQLTGLIKLLDCRVALFTGIHVHNAHGVLLGGRNSEGKAVVYWLSWDGEEAKPRELWAGERGGSICALALSSDARRLWGVENEHGQLLTWDVEPGLLASKLLRLPSPSVWLRSAQPFRSLAYSPTIQQVVCGGDGGLAVALDALNGAFRWLANCDGNLGLCAYLPDYETGAWLLCGDHQSSLLVDQNGRVLGALEKAGPISAVAALRKHEQVLLGTLDGRIVHFTCKMPASSVEIEAPAEPSRAYPVRGWTVDQDQQDILFLLNQSKETTESLIALAVLKRFALYLAQHRVDPELEATFIAFFFRRTMEQRVVFLYWLRALWCEEAAVLPQENLGFTLNLLDQVWQNLRQNQAPDSGLWCEIVSSLLGILDAPCCDQRATTLRTAVLTCIWRCDTDHLPPALRHGHTLSAIRLNQALKIWHSLPASLTLIQRFFQWCNALAKHTGARDAETLRTDLAALFGVQLRLVGWNDPWQIWLENLVVPAEHKAAPEPLLWLESPIAKPLLPAQLQRLKAQFPANLAWDNWLAHWDTCLNAVQSAHERIPHEAWREQGAWLNLREHLTAKGAVRFTVDQNQALPALWWPRVTQRWLEYIDQQIKALEDRVHDALDDYLRVRVEDRWLGSQRVELCLYIVNHFPTNLRLERVLWNQQALFLTDLPRLLTADGKPVSQTLTLDSAAYNHLCGDLTLCCHAQESGRETLRQVKIDFQRQLARFNSDLAWQGTWQRLERLSQQHAEHGALFCWLDGDAWPEEERRRLKQEVEFKFSVQVDGLTHLAASAGENNPPLFSPDLALSAEPVLQLEQLHTLLPALAQLAAANRQAFALALWRAAKPLPPMIDAALKSLLPDAITAIGLLSRLLDSPQCVQTLLAALKDLPDQALGAWCGAEPFYAPQESAYDPTEIYFPSAALLNESLWRQLDASQVPDEELAAFLGITTSLAQQQRGDRLVFFQALDNLFNVTEGADAAGEAGVQRLLTKLGSSVVQTLGGDARGWWQPTHLTLEWQDYECCFVLPKSTPQQHTALKNQRKGLWLCLGESAPPKALPGLALALSRRDCLALLHTAQPNQALRWLNGIAARQHGVARGRAFRDAIGLGSLVDRHFGGRQDELGELWHCLAEADRPQGKGSALIIGGRRMGKTSLRERILYEIRGKEPQRVCLEFNFECMPGGLRSMDLQYWFFKEWIKKFSAADKPLEDVWSGALRDNETQRNQAWEKLRQHLRRIRDKTGHTVLLTFDETEHLIRADTRGNKDRYALFGLLRTLIQDGDICLFATSYPHGANEPNALNVAIHDAGSPVHNTFSQILELAPWSPGVAWDYLQEKLSGLGVVLPRNYRGEVLQISRGIPWVIHRCGLEICDALPAGMPVVDRPVWRTVRQRLLEQLRDHMKVSVASVSERLDTERNLSLENAPERCLGGGRLWRELCAVAAAQPIATVATATDWPTVQTFTAPELYQRLPGVEPGILDRALMELIASPLLEGRVAEKGVYRFANNLLPICLSYWQGVEQ